MNFRSLPGLSRVQLAFAAGALLLSSFGVVVASVNSQPVQPEAAVSAQASGQAVNDRVNQSQHEANIAAPDMAGLAS